VVLSDGIVFISQHKNSGHPEKVALYHCELGDYGEKPNSFQIVHSKRTKRAIFQANDDVEMQEWLNAVLKQKFVIENTIDSIVVEQ